MKKLIYSMLVITLCFTGMQLKAQDETAIVTATEEANNLDLVAVMSLFQEAKDLADFERLLNDPVKGINNIDLNRNGEADYIRVMEKAESNYRMIILQSVVGDNDFQDIAVINVEQGADNKVKVVCKGDEVLYGVDYYVEPSPEIYVRVHYWPIWTVIFAPRYVYYYSPYYWGYYPGYYTHYHVVPYYDYYNRIHVHHNGHYYYHHQPSFQPPRHIYTPQRSNNVVYNPNTSRPGGNTPGTRPNPSTVDTRPGIQNNTTSPNTRTGNQVNTNPTNRPTTVDNNNTSTTSRTYTRPVQSTTNTRPTTTRTTYTESNTRSTQQPTTTAPATRTPVTTAPATTSERRTTTPPTQQQTRTVERPQQTQHRQTPPSTRTTSEPVRTQPAPKQTTSPSTRQSPPAKSSPANPNTRSGGGNATQRR